MNEKLTRYAIVILFMLGTLLILPKILSGTSSIIVVPLLCLLMLPWIVSLASASQAYWTILALTSVMSMGRIDVHFLQAFRLGYVLNGFLLVMLIAQVALHKQRLQGVFSDGTGKALLCYTLLTTIRFFIDRPGSAITGGEGGLGSALPILLSGWCFFSVATFSFGFSATRKGMKVLFWCIFLGILGVVHKNFFYLYPKSNRIGLFTYPASWSFAFFICNLFLEKDKIGDFLGNIRSYVWSIFILLAGVFSINRISIIYAMAAIGLVFWSYKKTRSFFWMIIPLFVLLLTVAFLFPSILPPSAQRTMSLFMPSSDLYSIQSSFGEVGWASEWRTELARIAWDNIKENPLIGEGFSFSFQEIYYSAALAQSGDAARFGGLLTAGAYHNGILFLAVKVGLPATLLFIFGALSIYVRFVFFGRKLSLGLQKRFCVMLSAVFLCATAKMLTNGSSPDIFNMSIMLGVMQGILLSSPSECRKMPEITGELISNKEIS